jgi:chromosome segregation ATPase
MFQKIKDLTKIKGNIDELKEEFHGLKKSFSKIKDEIKHFEKLFSEQNKLIDHLSKELVEIRETKNAINKEVYDFKLLRSDIQKKIINEFSSEIKKDLDSMFNQLKTDVDSFNKLKQKVLASKSILDESLEEIKKLNAISSRIKESDFELSKYARHLMENDREKLELMKKIDSLERLIAKMRRNKQ